MCDGKCSATDCPRGTVDSSICGGGAYTPDNTIVKQPTKAEIIAKTNQLIKIYQTAVTNNDWDAIITTGRELRTYTETYQEILISDVYYEQNMDDLINMIDNNEVKFEEVCHNGGSYKACTTKVSDTGTLSCEQAEQRFKQDYVSVPAESMTVSYLKSQLGLIDEVVSKCSGIRTSEEIASWNSARSQAYTSLSQLEQTCNTMDARSRPQLCN
jgi:hypothetical protein